jgi:ribosome-binding factor A
MPREFSRARRVGEQIRRELAPVLQRVAKDQSLGFVTLTGVDVSPDLRHAKLFVTALGGRMEHSALIDALNARAGFFRQHIAKGLRLRTVPLLGFAFDESIERGARISELLKHPPDRDGSSDDEAGQ